MTVMNANAVPTMPSIAAMLQTYRGWVGTVAECMNQAVGLLKGLYAEQDRTIEQLKKGLARRNSLRRADFDNIFAAVLARRDQTRKPLSQLVQSYCANREAVLHDLQTLFKGNVARAQEAWPGLKARLLGEADQDDGVRQAVTALRRIHVEQEELSAALAGLLTRVDTLKLDDLKTVASRLAARDARSVKELADLLAVCEQAARQADEKWGKLAG